MSLKVTIVVGNPKPMSRTRGVAEHLVARLFAHGAYDLDVIDLADYAGKMFEWPSDEMAALNAAVASSDFVVFATPTYKGTFTGLLKAFLDRYPANGLAGVVVIPLHTGANYAHSMGPTYNLAPLLVELGATVPGRGFYLALSELDRVDDIVDAAAREYATNLERLAGVAAALQSAPTVS